MKRQLFATMLLICTMTVQAQVNFGTKVGFNLTSFWGDHKVAGGICDPGDCPHDYFANIYRIIWIYRTLFLSLHTK